MENVKGSKQISALGIKTREQLFCHTEPSPESCLLAARGGMDPKEALERAFVMVDAVERTLREQARRSDEANSSDLSSSLYVMAYALEPAKALISAVTGGLMAAAH